MLDVFLDFPPRMVLDRLGDLFGIDDGLLTIPALGVIFDLDQQLTQGIVLVMMVSNVVLALWRYHQHNRIDLRQAEVLALTGLSHAFLVSSVVARIGMVRMREVLVIFLLALTGYMFWRLFRHPPQGGATPRYGLPRMDALGLGAGSLGGFFRVGGGVLATPVLASVLGLTQVVVQDLALVLAVPSTAVALGTYVMHGHVDWRMGVPPALGDLLSISWGARLAHTVPECSPRMVFCAFFALCTVFLLVRG